MTHKPTRLERFAKVFPFLVVGTALGVGALYAEYRFNGTILLRAAYLYTTAPIRGGLLHGPAGDYSISFANTRFDWRLVSRGVGEVGPALTVIGHPGWRLEVYEAAAGAASAPLGDELPDSGGMRVGPDGSAQALVRAGGKELALRFIPAPARADAFSDPRIRADMRDIRASVKTAAVQAQ
ncbi:MAG: hypothetical protein HY928_01225 [Elusimicrobia bacterium]|nr:hypothetical protein [Elusimicrobiota bacterium]